MKFALILALLPFATQADPQPAVAELMHYMDGIAPCFDAATDSAGAETCIGQGAGVCMEAEDGGYSTIGMTFCTLAEYEAWDRLLNRDYATTLETLREMDAQDSGMFPDMVKRADALRTAQRAWIPLRDATCALEYAMWGAGTMRQIAGSSCRLTQTAQRTIYLRFLGEQMQ